MLVLTRKIGESVRIGDNITVTVQRVAGNRVALSFDAPREVRIVRSELETFSAPESPAVEYTEAAGTLSRMLAEASVWP